jgi:hypothetical protein
MNNLFPTPSPTSTYYRLIQYVFFCEISGCYMASMNVTAFWDIVLCFKCMYCLHHQGDGCHLHVCYY